MMKIRYPFILSIFFIFWSQSCSNTVKTSKNSQSNIKVTSAFYTPIIRGSGTSKGIKIGLKVWIPSETTLDSVTYEGLTKELTLLKTISDTALTEVYFYPSKKVGQPEVEFSATTCIVHYTYRNTPIQLVVSDMELVTDDQFWK